MWKWRTMPSSLLSVHHLIFAKFVRWPPSNALMTISITEFLNVMIQAWPCSTEDTVRDHLRKGSFISESLLSMCHSFNPVFNLFCAAEVSDSSFFPSAFVLLWLAGSNWNSVGVQDTLNPFINRISTFTPAVKCHQRRAGWTPNSVRVDALLPGGDADPVTSWAAEIAMAFLRCPAAMSVWPSSRPKVPAWSRCSALPFSIIHPRICRAKLRLVSQLSVQGEVFLLIGATRCPFVSGLNVIRAVAKYHVPSQGPWD